MERIYHYDDHWRIQDFTFGGGGVMDVVNRVGGTKSLQVLTVEI